MDENFMAGKICSVLSRFGINRNERGVRQFLRSTLFLAPTMIRYLINLFRSRPRMDRPRRSRTRRRRYRHKNKMRHYLHKKSQKKKLALKSAHNLKDKDASKDNDKDRSKDKSKDKYKDKDKKKLITNATPSKQQVDNTCTYDIENLMDPPKSPRVVDSIQNFLQKKRNLEGKIIKHKSSLHIVQNKACRKLKKNSDRMPKKYKKKLQAQGSNLDISNDIVAPKKLHKKTIKKLSAIPKEDVYTIIPKPGEENQNPEIIKSHLVLRRSERIKKRLAAQLAKEITFSKSKINETSKKSAAKDQVAKHPKHAATKKAKADAKQ